MDDLFTFNNPGYWLVPERWPSWSVEEENSEYRRSSAHWEPKSLFLLRAVHLIGAKAWGDRWRTPPFRLDRPDGAAAFDRFMRIVLRVRAWCSSGVIPAHYEVLKST